MDFGRIEDAGAVDFRLPPPDPRSRSRFAGREGPVTVRIGCPGWNAGLGDLWPTSTRGGSRGPRYRSGDARPADRLSCYARYFNAVELNATFHAVPDRSRVEAWAAAVPERFRFCAKVPRAVSHADRDAWRAPAAAFAHAFTGFGPRAGPAFFQAPPEAEPAHLDELLARIDALGPAVGALELRHPAWFVEGRLLAPIFEAMVARGLGPCLSDTPGRRDVVHASLTGPRMIVRFMADPGAPTTRDRLRAWATRLRGWGRYGLREAWIFVHQPDNLGLIETAAIAAEELGDLLVPPEATLPVSRGLFALGTVGPGTAGPPRG